MAAIRQQSATREHGRKRTDTGLDALGIRPQSDVYWNLNTPELYEVIARRGEGLFSAHGALMVDTGEHTGRAAKDKAIVREPSSEDKVFWGEVNKEFPQEKFDAPARPHDGARLGARPVRAGHLRRAQTRATVCLSASSPSWPGTRSSRAPCSSTTTRGAREAQARVHRHQHPELQGRPRDATARAAETFILMDFAQRLVLIGGTSYAGETKKSRLHHPQLPAAAARRDVDALLGERRRRRATWPSSSGSRGRARRLSRPTPSAGSSATTSTAGLTTASSTSRAAATPRSSSSRRRPSPTSIARRACSAPSWRTSSSTRRRASLTSTTPRRPRTRAPPIR